MLTPIDAREPANCVPAGAQADRYDFAANVHRKIHGLFIV
jgi:hypothetical protein